MAYPPQLPALLLSTRDSVNGSPGRRPRRTRHYLRGPLLKGRRRATTRHGALLERPFTIVIDPNHAR